ncbi:zf-PARP-domain-containing protein, partial [Ceratobasidium sp. AG-I]
MSDNEGNSKKTGYRLEYAPSGRAKCSGPKPCSGTLIKKGELRMGSLVDVHGNKSFKWRHWGCTTALILSKFKNQFEQADELDGFEELNDEDKDRVRSAWAEGHVAEEDIPESAIKDKIVDGDDAEKPKKAAPKRKKVHNADDAEEKPKKKR